MISKRLASLCRFALVGCLGFVVDATIVFLLVQLLGAEPINARIPAWLLAVSTTYFFNLLFTFKTSKAILAGKRQRLRRYFLYVLSQLCGGFVNILVFSLLISLLGMQWLVSLVIGTLVGLVFNFLGASAVIAVKNVGPSACHY